jgi:uncharacterized protein YciW
LEFASACAQVIADVFSATFGKKDKNRERFKRLKARMEADYWDELAGQFRQFVLDMGQRETQLARFGAWLDAVQATAQGAFERAAEATPDDGSSLRLRVEGRNRCCDELFKTRYQRRFVTGAKA